MKPDSNMTRTGATIFFIGLVAFFATLMFVLEYLPVWGLMTIIVVMFVVGFLVPQPKCKSCDMSPLSKEERIHLGIDGLD